MLGAHLLVANIGTSNKGKKILRYLTMAPSCGTINPVSRSNESETSRKNKITECRYGLSVKRKNQKKIINHITNNSTALSK
jgi:hypothetical protein